MKYKDRLFDSILGSQGIFVVEVIFKFDFKGQVGVGKVEKGDTREFYRGSRIYEGEWYFQVVIGCLVSYLRR